MVWLNNAEQDATLHLNCTVQAIDAANKSVTDDQGTIHHYEKLLLATGGTPRRLASDCDSVIYFRTLDDYHNLRMLAQERRRFAVIGGGFIGSEIAAALALNGMEVVMIFPTRGSAAGFFHATCRSSSTNSIDEKEWKCAAGKKCWVQPTAATNSF